MSQVVKIYRQIPRQVEAAQMPTYEEHASMALKDAEEKIRLIAQWLDAGGASVTYFDTRSITIQTQRKEVNIGLNSWILRTNDGAFHIYSDKAFKKHYEEVH